MTLAYVRITEEVLYTTLAGTHVDEADVAALKTMAATNARRRIRLCAHPGVEDSLHQMLIVHARGNYVPPHRHPGKSESYHMVEGDLDVVIFDDAGRIESHLTLGPTGSGKPFFYRLSESRFHTLIPRSDWVVFHEITNGPFRREEMVIAPWAPDDDAPAAELEAYAVRLSKELAG
ncbi:MAG: WbuC family cupin fold metalloprotein [Magnetospirillum sp. WYHS-4]